MDQSINPCPYYRAFIALNQAGIFTGAVNVFVENGCWFIFETLSSDHASMIAEIFGEHKLSVISCNQLAGMMTVKARVIR
ncbi:hypothetical protein [Tellurirhabdus bombi]|uniref:hypothetical protein n=1 Tax=Tellurirhabdus bombi TaxID=2907205 RepID=UPI001F374DED|nr:hypothetical protein [Tellurirhabdus bombi]